MERCCASAVLAGSRLAIRVPGGKPTWARRWKVLPVEAFAACWPAFVATARLVSDFPEIGILKIPWVEGIIVKALPTTVCYPPHPPRDP